MKGPQGHGNRGRECKPLATKGRIGRKELNLRKAVETVNAEARHRREILAIGAGFFEPRHRGTGGLADKTGWWNVAAGMSSFFKKT